jgi:acyl-coenzyme A thioesterase PaaI-like protein
MNTQGTSVERDFRQRALANDVSVARLVGFKAKDIAQGHATVELAAGPQHANPMGTLHSGILCDIADAAMGLAFANTLAPGESFTTVELKINFFRPSGKPNSKRKEPLYSGGASSATWNAT